MKLFSTPRRQPTWTIAMLLMSLNFLAACGSDADPPQPILPVTPAVIAPTVVSPPVSITVQQGQVATFSVTAAGTAPLSYQWQRDGSTIANATSASYTTLATVASDDGAQFSVVITNAAGSVVSASAKLTVSPPLSFAITLQPKDANGIAGQQVTFSANADCNQGSISWVWQRSGAGGTSWMAIVGATSAIYVFTSEIADNAASFRALATCGAQTLTTNMAILTVTMPAPGQATIQELPQGLSPSAGLSAPAGLVIDSTGNSYIVDSLNDRILKLDIAGNMVLLAGARGVPGSADGSGAAAHFNEPLGIALGSDGNLYVTDTGNCTLRRITPSGVVGTVAGTAGACGAADGAGPVARFNAPFAITTGSDGALYLGDSLNYTIRRVALSGAVTTLAGMPSNAPGYADGTAGAAKFGYIGGIAGDTTGNLYVSDEDNSTIRRVTLSGVVTTFAGSGSTTASDGVGIAAGIPWPGALTLSSGALYLTAVYSTGFAADFQHGYGQIRKIDLASVAVTTLSGVAASNALPPVGVYAIADGAASQAVMSFGDQSNTPNISGIATALDGSVYFVEQQADALRRVAADGSVNTLIHGNSSSSDAGSVLANAAFGDSGSPISLTLASNGDVIVADSSDIRRINPAGAVSLVAGLHDTDGAIDGSGSRAQFYFLNGIATSPDGSFEAVDSINCAIRKVTAAGIATTDAGTLTHCGSIDGPPGTAELAQPNAIAIDGAGNLYVADSSGQVIRKIHTDGSISTLAGSATQAGFVDGTGSAALFEDISAIVVSSDGSLYVGQPDDSALRVVSSAGEVTTLALSMSVNVNGISIGPDGVLYLVDANANKLFACTPSGVVTLLAEFGPVSLNADSVSPISLTGSVIVLGPKTLAVGGTRTYLNSTMAAQSVYVITLP